MPNLHLLCQSAAGPLAGYLLGEVGKYMLHKVSISTTGFPSFLTDNTWKLGFVCWIFFLAVCSHFIFFFPEGGCVVHFSTVFISTGFQQLYKSVKLLKACICKKWKKNDTFPYHSQWWVHLQWQFGDRCKFRFHWYFSAGPCTCKADMIMTPHKGTLLNFC